MINTKIFYENNKIEFPNGTSHIFEFSIAELLELPNMTIVRLEVPPEIVFNVNVYGLSKKGNIIWQVEKIEYIHENSPYTGMTIKGNMLVLFNWDGLEVHIDPESGRVLNKIYGK